LKGGDRSVRFTNSDETSDFYPHIKGL